MKIYFAASIRGGREDAELYLQIVAHLKKKGEVLTEHVGNKDLTACGEQELGNQYIHDRDLEWLLASKVIVAEVTVPSLGVGYELRMAEEHHKNILALYRPQAGKSLSPMISGSPAITIKEYSTLEEAKRMIDDYFLTL